METKKEKIEIRKTKELGKDLFYWVKKYPNGKNIIGEKNFKTENGALKNALNN